MIKLQRCCSYFKVFSSGSVGKSSAPAFHSVHQSTNSSLYYRPLLSPANENMSLKIYPTTKQLKDTVKESLKRGFTFSHNQ